MNRILTYGITVLLLILAALTTFTTINIPTGVYVIFNLAIIIWLIKAPHKQVGAK